MTISSVGDKCQTSAWPDIESSHGLAASLPYQNKNTRARNLASYVGYSYLLHGKCYVYVLL